MKNKFFLPIQPSLADPQKNGPFFPFFRKQQPSLIQRTIRFFLALTFSFTAGHLAFAQAVVNPHPLMRDFIGVNTRASDEILFMKKFSNVREYHGWDIPYDVDNIANCPVQKLIFSPGTDQSTLTNFDGFYAQLPRKVFPALKWLAPEMRGLQNYELGVLEQKPWCVDGLTGIGVPPQYPALPLTNEQRAAPFQFDLVSRDINKELIVAGTRLFKNYVTITPNQTYTVEVGYTFVDAYSARNLKAWVDKDGNGTLDNTEAVYTSAVLGTGPTASGTATFTMNFSSTPANRCLKLRLSLLSNGSASSLEACASNGLGGGPEAFVYDVTLINDQGTLTTVNSYCDPGVLASGFVHGYIQSVTIKKGSTVVYQKNLKSTPPSNYFNDGSINRLTQGIGYKIKLDDSPDTKSCTAEIDANFDGAFSAGETTNFPQNSVLLIPINATNVGLTVLRLTNRNASGQITGIWEYPVIITGPGMNINGTTAISSLLTNTTYASTVQANDVTDNALKILEKISLPVDQESAATYLEYTKWVTTVAGRYGSVNVCSNGSNPYCSFMQNMVSSNDVGGSTASGKKLLTYVEMGNEPDKYWHDTEFKNTNEAIWQMAPKQYAALLNAAYDGAGSSTPFQYATNTYLGVKNIDPNMKVVMAGISEFRGGYIKDMIAKFLETRSGLAKKVPFDVINMHHYSGSTVPASTFVDNAWGPTYDYEGLTGGRGYCPEHAKLKERYAAFIVKMMNEATNADVKTELKNMEYWISEFGYSTNNLSPLRSRLELDLDNNSTVSQSYFKTQGQWLVRSLLELSAMEQTIDTKKIVLSKAQMYEMRDYLPAVGNVGDPSSFSPGGDLFSHHGLLTQNFKPKKSWYYVQTTKNVLGAARFVKDLNPITDPTPGYTQLQFDNGGEAPRIYYYKTDAGQRILAIWSPTSIKSEQQRLKIDIPTWLAGRIAETNFDIPVITQYTIVQIKDNTEYGVKSGHDVQMVNGIRNLVFDGTNAPVYISETPIFVLLGVKQSDVVADCPLPNEGEPGDIQITPKCTSALLKWNTPLPGSWRIFVAKRSSLPSESICNNYKNIDLLGNQFVTTQTYNLSASHTRFLLDGLTPNTQYVVFMLFVNNNRVPATFPCVRCFTTSETEPCIIDPCLKVEKVTGSAGCGSAIFDGCNIVPPNTTGVNCFGSGTGLCLSGNPGALINCTTYTAPVLTEPMFQSDHLWAGCSPFEIVITFRDFVLLDAIKFFHLTGNDQIAIYYSTCECPDEKRYLTTFKPYSSAQQWVSITNNLPVLPVKKLYFKKIASNHEREPHVTIGLLHFCGEITTECKLPRSGVMNDGPVRRGAFSTVGTDLAADREVAVAWKPVNRVADHEEYGTYNNYNVYVGKKIPGQPTQFNQATPLQVYHPEGEEEATAFLSDLESGTGYDVLIRVPIPTLCDFPSVPSDQINQSRTYGFQDTVIADTIISFVSNGVPGRDNVQAKNALGTKDQMLLYPNPTTGAVYANWNQTGYETLQVWTLEGILYKNIPLTTGTQEMLIDLADAPPGLYLVRLTGKNRAGLQKKLALIR